MSRQLSHGDNAVSLDQVIDHLHGAFHDPDQWPGLLDSLATYLGAHSAAIISQAPVERTGLIVTRQIPAGQMLQWQTRWQELDPWLTSLALPGPGKHLVYLGSELAHADSYDNTFVTEFINPNGLGYHLGAWIHPVAPVAGPYALMFWRRPGQDDFTQQDISKLAGIVRQLASLEQMSIANAMGRAGGLSSEQSAAFLLSATGSLLLTNRRGAEMIADELIRPSAQPIGFSAHSVTSWLQGIFNTVQRDPGLIDHPIDYRERVPGLGAVSLSVYPFRAIGAAPSLLGVRYGLTVYERNARTEMNLARMANRMYRWTDAELDTVRRLTDGYSVPDIARERACSVETVRSHLKNAKRKAGVNRQVELVRVMIAMQGRTG